MFRKILHIAGWVLVLGYMAVALSFVSITEKKVICNKVDILIADSTEHFFVEEEDVLALFNDKRIKLKGIPVSNINLARVENILRLHPSVKKAEVYTTVEGTLKIDIFQRNPVIRIINEAGDSYYIDEDAKLMPLSDKYTAHVLIMSGHINQPMTKNTGKDLSVPSDGTLKEDSILHDLFAIGKYIYKNKLWKSQIEQIYINGENEIEMVPRVGFQNIIFGTAENYEDKFNKLAAIYNYGFNNVGWNKYSEINLKYNNQVICTKIE